MQEVRQLPSEKANKSGGRDWVTFEELGRLYFTSRTTGLDERAASTYWEAPATEKATETTDEKGVLRKQSTFYGMRPKEKDQVRRRAPARLRHKNAPLKGMLIREGFSMAELKEFYAPPDDSQKTRRKDELIRNMLRHTMDLIGPRESKIFDQAESEWRRRGEKATRSQDQGYCVVCLEKFMHGVSRSEEAGERCTCR